MHIPIRVLSLTLLLAGGTAWGGDRGGRAVATGDEPAREVKAQGDVVMKGRKITSNSQGTRKIQDGTSKTIMVGETGDASKNDAPQPHSHDGRYMIESVPHRSGAPAGQHNQTDMEFIHEKAD